MMLFKGSYVDVVFIATIFPRAEDINKSGQLVTNIKAFNDLLLLPKSCTAWKFHIRFRDGSGITKLLKWSPVDMTADLPYHEMRDERFYCINNLKKKNPDKTHLNALYLEVFYKKLDSCISKFVRKNQVYKQM